NRALRGLPIGRERKAERLRGDHDAANVKGGKGKPQTPVEFAHAGAVRHQRVELEIGGLRAANPHLVAKLVDDDTAHVLVNHEGCDTAPTRRWVGLREYHVIA